MRLENIRPVNSGLVLKISPQSGKQIRDTPIGNNQSFIRQALKAVDPSGEKVEAFSPLESDTENKFDHEISKIKLHLTRAYKNIRKRNMNEKQQRVENLVRRISEHTLAVSSIRELRNSDSGTTE